MKVSYDKETDSLTITLRNERINVEVKAARGGTPKRLYKMTGKNHERKDPPLRR